MYSCFLRQRRSVVTKEEDWSIGDWVEAAHDGDSIDSFYDLRDKDFVRGSASNDHPFGNQMNEVTVGTSQIQIVQGHQRRHAEPFYQSEHFHLVTDIQMVCGFIKD